MAKIMEDDLLLKMVYFVGFKIVSNYNGQNFKIGSRLSRKPISRESVIQTLQYLYYYIYIISTHGYCLGTFCVPRVWPS